MKGIGIDILETGRVEPMVDSQMRGFIRQFTEKEIEEVLKQENQYIAFAKRFSLKEAVYKSLHKFEGIRSFQEIEILTDSNGILFVSLYGRIKEIADKNGISQILLSVSYERRTIVSMAFAE